MLAAVVGFAVALYDLELSRLDGALLMAGMLAAAALIIRWAKLDARAVPDAHEDEETPRRRPVIEVLVGVVALGATLLGAELLVRGGSALAVQLGMSSAFVGLTVVAVGTSLPELATSLASARRNEQDMVLGNVVGSNLFNALAVGGSAAIVSPSTVDPSFRLTSMLMVGGSAIAGLLAITGRQLVRWEGFILLAAFIGFIYLTLQ